jgi:hypothetical protein
MYGRPKEDSDVISASQSLTNNRPHFPHITPALAATAPQESVVALDSQIAALAKSTSMISESDNPGMP